MRPQSLSLLRVALAAVSLSACSTTERAQVPAQVPAPYPHANEPIGALREIYDGVLTPDAAIRTFRNIDRLLPVATVPASTSPRALEASGASLPELRITDNATSYSLEEFLEGNRVAALLVLHNGRIVEERYRYDNTPRTRWMSMSVAKSVTSTLVGAALRDGSVTSLDDQVVQYVPALAGSAYDGVTVRQVLMMASGVSWRETYTDSTSDRRHLLDAQLSLTPGSLMQVMGGLPRAAPPGTVNNYNTGETQVVAEVVRSAVGKPLAEYLSERIWQPYGMEAAATWWLEAPGGVEIGGSGFSATLRDYGRLGQFILDDGVIGTDSVLPSGWVAEASSPKELLGGAPLDYGYLWWPGTSDAARSDGAFSGEGIHGQFLYINPTARVVIVLWSARPQPTGGALVDEWAFFEAVVDAVALFAAKR